MIFIKDTIDIQRCNFKKIKILSFILFIVFINCCLCNFVSANSNTYTVTLPQKTDGIEKIEYFIDDMPYGSTAGVPSLELSKEVKLNFLVQFASEGYSQTKLKDVKIISTNNEPATLNTYGYDENGNITTFEPRDEDTIDPSQNYISSPIFVSSEDAFSFSKMESDKYNLIINLSDSNELIDEALKVKYQYSTEEFSYASTDPESNTLKIPNINLNSSLKLWFDPTSAYSNSDINVYKSDEKLTQNENDKSFNIYVENSDVYIQVGGIRKNQYNLIFDNSDNTSFKFKNINSDMDFSTSNENPIVVSYGDSYCFICDSTNLNENHEVTVNNNVIRPKNGIYSINNISENLIVSLTEKNSAFYNVSLENISEFLNVTDTQNNPISEGTVKYSDAFKFKASAKEAYTQKENEILIYSVPASIANSESLKEQLENYLLTPSLEGIYTTPSVTEPMVIIATNATKNSYQVTLPEKISGASYTVTENENVIALSKNQFKVTHGESLEISLIAETGYDVTDAELITDNKSAQISKNGKTYLLKNVTDDTYLVAHGIKTAKCKVTFDSKGFICKDLNNIAIDSTDTYIDYDSEKLNFKVEVAKGYELKSSLNVSISDGEGVLIPPSQEDFYTLTNVHSNIKLSVTGAELIPLTVTITNDNENLELRSVESNNKILPNQNTVRYGENFTFQVVDKNNETPVNLDISSSTDSKPIKISDDPLTYSLNVSQDTELTVLQNPQFDTGLNKQKVAAEKKTVYLPAKYFRIDTGASISPRVKIKPDSSYANFCNANLNFNYDKDDRFAFDMSEVYANFSLDKELKFTVEQKFPYKVLKSSSYKIYSYKTKDDDEDNKGNAKKSTLEECNMVYKSGFSIPGFIEKPPSQKSFYFDKDYFENPVNIKNYGWQETKDNITYKYKYYVISLRVEFKAPLNCTVTFNDPSGYENEKPIEYYKVSTDSPIEESDYVKVLNKTLITDPQEFIPDDSDYPFYFVAKIKEGFMTPIFTSDAGKVTKIGQVAGTTDEYLYNITDFNREYDSTNRKITIYPKIEKKKYSVDFSDSIGTKFKLDNDDYEILKQNIPHGESLEFYTISQNEKLFQNPEYYVELKSANENKIIDIQSLVNGEKNTKTYNSDSLGKLPIEELTISRSTSKGLNYKIKGITGELKIIVKRKLLNYTINFPVDNKEIIFLRRNNLEKLESKIETSQQSFSFFIQAEEGYDISNIIVKANNVTIEPKNGYYTIPLTDEEVSIKNTTTQVTITVSGVSKYNYTVSFTSYEDVTYKDSSNQNISNELKVDYGKEISFSVSISGAHSNSNIKVNAEPLSGGATIELQLNEKTNLYTLNNIQDNYRIFVEGLKLNEYTLRFRHSDNISYYDQYGIEKLASDEQNSEFIIKNVNYGETFGFKVLPNEGVDASEINVYYAQSSSSTQSSKKLLPINDVYYIENVTTDIIIHVENTKNINYQVEIRTTEGVKCLDSFGNVLSSQISVDHGGSLYFTLSLDPAYNNANPIVSVKGSTNVLSPSSNGIYTLENITENKIIEVSNVTKNTYRIKFKETEGVIYRTVKNKDFTEYLDAEYGDVQQFKISIMDAYDQSSPIVLLNNSKVLNANGGIYTIENVEANLEVTVENVVKNPEETTMEDINDVPESIISSADVDKVVAATKTYESLPEEQKTLVTNTNGLNAAQEEAKTVNHNSNDVTVTGIDWNIKLIVTPLTDDKEAMESLNAEIDRRTLLSLHEMKLINLLTNEYYEVPYGQEVSVTMPCGNLEEYENIVVVHKNSGGGIEYLDVDINNGTASFKTSSFSQFGLAGKKIPNYSENPSDLKISVSDLVENEDELKNLLGEGLTSQLGELINLEDNESEMTTNSNDNISNSNSSDNQNLEHSIEKIYRWATNNEFLSVIIILIIGFLIILLILFIGKKKKEE